MVGGGHTWGRKDVSLADLNLEKLKSILQAEGRGSQTELWKEVTRKSSNVCGFSDGSHTAPESKKKSQRKLGNAKLSNDGHTDMLGLAGCSQSCD